MQETIALILDYVRSTWRFRWPALGIAWLVCLVGWAVVSFLPDRYQASARAYVDTYSELRRLMPGQIVESNVQEQLRFVRESMLGRPQLERLARYSDLDLGVETPEDMTVLVADLRSMIKIGVASNNPNSRARDAQPTGNIYTITYQHADRTKAVEVVNNLMNIFIEDTIGAQQSTSLVTGEFLRDQIADYEERLRVAEERIAEFNRQYYDRLPGMQGGYFQRLQTEMAAFTAAKERLALAESRLASINSQLRGDGSQLAGSENVLTQSIDRRIREADVRLQDLLMRYTERHPDVIAAQENIEQLRVRREEVATAVNSGDLLTSTDSPVLQALQIARNEAEAEVATIRAEVRTRENRIEELRSLIDEVPGVEAQMVQLTRDYDVVNTQYRNLLGSLERDSLSRDAQQSESVEFRIIDPPTAGVDPVYPPRETYLVLVLLAGLGAGGFYALLMSQVKPVFNSAAALLAATGMQVIGTVGRYAQAIDRRSQHASVLLFAGGILALVATFGGIFAVELLGGGVRSFL